MQRIHSHIQNALIALKVGDLGSTQSALECAAKLVEEKFTSTNSAMYTQEIWDNGVCKRVPTGSSRTEENHQD